MGWHVKAKSKHFKDLAAQGFNTSVLRRLDYEQIDDAEDWDFADIKFWLHDAALAGRYLIMKRDLKLIADKECW